MTGNTPSIKAIRECASDLNIRGEFKMKQFLKTDNTPGVEGLMRLANRYAFYSDLAESPVKQAEAKANLESAIRALVESRNQAVKDRDAAWSGVKTMDALIIERDQAIQERDALQGTLSLEYQIRQDHVSRLDALAAQNAELKRILEENSNLGTMPGQKVQ